MIWNLVMKDFRAFGKSILYLTLLCLCTSWVMTLLFYNTWTYYMILACGQICFIIAFYSMQEKSRHGEAVTSSFPVTRKQIIWAKYVTVFIMIFAGLILYTLNAHIISLIGIEISNSSLLMNPIVLFILLLFLVSFISLFIPLVIVLRTPWVIINLSILCIGIISLVILQVVVPLFNINEMSFDSTTILSLFGLLILILFLSYISLYLSTRIFLRREL